MGARRPQAHVWPDFTFLNVSTTWNSVPRHSARYMFLSTCRLFIVMRPVGVSNESPRAASATFAACVPLARVTTAWMNFTPE